MKYVGLFICLFLLNACQPEKKTTEEKIRKTSLVILGTVQDAGSPHIACRKDCCKNLFIHPDKNRMVVSLGVILPASQETYLFEATPNMPAQMKMLNQVAGFEHPETPNGIFLTHAHIGHYAGLMYLGKEAMNADSVPVFVMPRMHDFLATNGPWSQLVNNKNISLYTLEKKECDVFLMPETSTKKQPSIQAIAIPVPHRDEYSETVGYIIQGEHKTALFIPDIDKWEKWEIDIKKQLEGVDYAFLDGTFYDGNELSNRNMKDIPHPFVVESMELFKNFSPDNKKKIHFIHFNHTNPLLNKNSPQYKEVIKRGFKVAYVGDVFEL